MSESPGVCVGGVLAKNADDWAPETYRIRESEGQGRAADLLVTLPEHAGTHLRSMFSQLGLLQTSVLTW